jgi:hypothetical protein
MSFRNARYQAAVFAFSTFSSANDNGDFARLAPALPENPAQNSQTQPLAQSPPLL